MNYIKQTLYEMRHHKMMTWISVSGTAVSIFLVMIFFMYNSLPTVQVSPESNRQRIYGSGQYYVMATSSDQSWSFSGGMVYPVAELLYGNLDGVECVSYSSAWSDTSDIFMPGQPPVTVASKLVDGNYWRIFDFKFISGRPFTEEEALNTSVRPIVINESSARKVFGTPDTAGKEINVGGVKYLVSGVVEDTSPIFKNSWSDIFLPLTPDKRRYTKEVEGKNTVGDLHALMLFAEGTDPENITNQVTSRYATLNERLKDFDALAEFVEDTPRTPEVMGSLSTWKTNNVKKIAQKQYLIYLLLILLPAINLGSMMRGRLQHRISEIGVRRAYGARRLDIISQLLGENLMVTVAGGISGLLLSYLFMIFLSSEFFSMVTIWTDSLEVKMATPSFSMLFSWKPFVISIATCLILNIITATVPAWRAASVEPAIAISKSKS